jgi:hypothetical protein
MNDKLNEIIKINRLRLTVTVPTVLWTFIFTLLIHFGVGWRNLFDLLPHEIAIVFLTFIMPILLVAIIYIVLGTMAEIRQVTINSQQHGELIKTFLGKRSASSSATKGSAK